MVGPAINTHFGPDWPEIDVQWSFLADLAAWSGVAVPPPPWTIDGEGHIVGGPAVDGVLWSHVAFYQDEAIEEVIVGLPLTHAQGHVGAGRVRRE